MADAFLDIPDELKIKIFQLAVARERPESNGSEFYKSMQMLSSVCRDWQRLFSDRAFWGKLQLSTYPRLKDGHLTALQIRCPILQELSVAGCNGLSLAAITAALANCRQLTSLNVSATPAACGALIGNLATLTPLLRHFACGGGGAQVTDASLSGLAALPLVSLDLRRCFAITDAGMATLASCEAPRLTHLDLTGCWKISEEGVKTVCARFPALESLILFGCTSIKDKAFMEVIGNSLKSLKCLDVSWCWTNFETDVNLVPPTIPSLERLYLTGYEYLQDETFTNMIASCARLTTVDLNGCRHVERGLEALLRTHGGTLRTLLLRECLNLTNEMVELIGATCPDLRMLDLGDCGSISDKGLLPMLAGCTRLEGLGLARVQKLTRRSLKQMAATNRGLRGLDLQMCVNVNAEDVIMILKDLPELVSLCVGHRGAVNAAFVVAITPLCKKLRHLSLVGCRHLKPEDIMSFLTSGQTHLETLAYSNELPPDAAQYVGKVVRGGTQLWRWRDWEVGTFDQFAMSTHDFIQ